MKVPFFVVIIVFCVGYALGAWLGILDYIAGVGIGRWFRR